MNILIVEDEPAAARRIEKLIMELEPDARVMDVLDTIEGVVQKLEGANQIDLIFLDIHLADGSSFEIFRLINVKTPVVFTTAYDDYAIQAFKVNAIDYLLKPIKKTELKAAFDRFKNLGARTYIDYSALAQQITPQPKRFLIRFGQQIKVVEQKDVAYFYTKDKVSFLVNFEGRRYPIDYSLERLEEIIDGRSFFRINRQFIINLKSIREMHAYSKSRVKIDLQPSSEIDTIVSTERSPLFKRWLAGE